MAVAKQDPNMQMMIHFLNFRCLRWKCPIIMTPIMPLMTGEPPTAAIASESLPNHGLSSCESVMEIALNRPK